MKNNTLVILFLIVLNISNVYAADYIDEVIFGNNISEQSHNLTQIRSEVITGSLGQSARCLLPLEPVSHNGGSVSFNIKVDPAKQNYITVKLWGSDCSEEKGRLILYIDGNLQVGYRHEGDHDVLNQCDEAPLYSGRFVYQTVALPIMHTRGKNIVSLKIAALGRMWPYGPNFEKKQRKLTEPSRGIYRVYSHTSTRFEPGLSEKQGKYFCPEIRPAIDGEEILLKMQETVNSRLMKIIDDKSVKSSYDRSADGNVLLLAEAYKTPWTVAYNNQGAIEAMVRVGDEFLYPGVIGKNWGGAGPLGEAIYRVGAETLQKHLDQEMELPANFPYLPDWKRREPLEEPTMSQTNASVDKIRMTRRQAWSEVLCASLDWNRTNGRRFYTNQTMIVDMNLYSANLGLKVIDPDNAMPEKQALRYVYESMGISPWLGNDISEGGSTIPYGSNYYQVTRKGLSRELGYVGTYGETILKFSRDMAELTDDEKVMEQLINIQSVRLYFRYPSVDHDGYRTMKLASEIDARTAHFPVQYGAYTSANVRESWWMEVPALTKDPVSVGAAQQSLEDNQYFYRLSQRMRDKDTLGMMRNIDEYALVKCLPKSDFRLPMSEGQPDFVYSDEENAVIAMKHRNNRLFLNFYFRQEFGVSGVVRIMDITPEIMRIASVFSQFELNATGCYWERPDVIDFERWGGFNPPGEDIHQAWQGEKLPIAKRPEGVSKPDYGSWGPFVGKASFYWLRYGDYFFAINTTKEQTFTLPEIDIIDNAVDLVSGKKVNLNKTLNVRPLTTVVLYLGN